jgi:hypothetical protein
MALATLSTETKFVCPAEEFFIEHDLRCLTGNQGRIVEYAVSARIQYKHGIPFQLWKIFDDEGDVWYMDTNGWMFDGGVLHDLMLEKKLVVL